MGGWLSEAPVARFEPNLSYRPTVSVVILSHRPEMLPKALRSVWEQTVDPQLVEVVVKFGAVYHGRKLNEALKAASGEYIVILCDDDELAPTFLRDCLAVMRVVNRDRVLVDFVYTDIFLFGGPDGDRPMALPDFSLAATGQQAVPWMTALFHRSVFERLEAQDGYAYDPDQQYLDWDLDKRMARAGMRGERIPEPLFRAREHAANGHKQMEHGWAFHLMRQKFLFRDPPKAPEPEFVYPPWYEGRPDILLLETR